MTNMFWRRVALPTFGVSVFPTFQTSFISCLITAVSINDWEMDADVKLNQMCSVSNWTCNTFQKWRKKYSIKDSSWRTVRAKPSTHTLGDSITAISYSLFHSKFCDISTCCSGPRRTCSIKVGCRVGVERQKNGTMEPWNLRENEYSMSNDLWPNRILCYPQWR